MIKVITFDLDDTLWSIEGVIEQAEMRCYEWLQVHAPALTDSFSMGELRAHKLEFYQSNSTYRHQISRLRIDAMMALMTAVGIEQQQAKTMAEQVFEVFIEARHNIELFAEVPALMTELSSRYRLGALTNGNADISRLPLTQWLEFSFSAEQLDASKPAAAHFLAAINATGIKASQLLHVGDHPEHDIQGAQDAGCHAIWFNPAHRRWPLDRPEPQQIASLNDLPAMIELIDAD